MAEYINVFILIPLIGYVVSLLIPRKNEDALSVTAFVTAGLHVLVSVSFLVIWLINGHDPLDMKDAVLYKTSDYEFFVDFCYDKVTAVYGVTGSVLVFLVTWYSRYYMHREDGYKRFFNTVLFFFTGYNVTVFAGNFETLFAGWEILGLSSFLLIAFYRDRYLPVKNAVKVFSIYRLGDVGLLLAMWMSHHLWHQNITFHQLNNKELVHIHLAEHNVIGTGIAIMILITAAAKSAQLPFTSWLPRAMEGPTPSSAIFYGSLSVHLGVFLLLRTFPFWQEQIMVRWLIGILGLLTGFISTGIARVQSSIKSQIAYASAAQIGIIFLEIALGWEVLALFHFVSNACLRTYQLLISPSVVSYLIKDQFYNFNPNTTVQYAFIPKKWRTTFYMLCLKEWHLGDFIRSIYWQPIKFFGRYLHFITFKCIMILFLPVYILGILFQYGIINPPDFLRSFLPPFFAFIGLIMILRSFTIRGNPYLSFILVALNHFWIALAISFNAFYSFDETILYLGGIVLSAIVGLVALKRLEYYEGKLSLDSFSGHVFEHPRVAFIFLIACLGMAGFPITTAFIGEDLIFSHIQKHQLFLAFLISMSFVVDGLALIRLYARLFLGVHFKDYHERAYRSS
ncbi:MAG: proton-conducting transporter membrane subunit [Sediminibacterium sp.]|nr:proton-conducting transporter membrane subunit [Sediminibacterium sp.]